ncbi:prepilin-type N-terminal cleavage/methylation domain-containing protein [Leifsonia shinshuensis]|uniref:prepilin-type N-terminal cleavage/methylation domain-containing protein n=1 Tax=Leifsonia shinshuensis TaxID=150026 RepID=UPI00285BCD60|nr:prepilin-type N-terminal cleavage/methylation domain-containing protein [Leifsonia shinshuensis]MDR6971508.1 prepilin-type N-terminal cleavage/methylation domain-containing protein [Leifsonia shinshuensis]
MFRRSPAVDDDSGLTLIEVMVAMFIFGLISVGIAASLTNALQLTRDTRAREIATNLAAQEIDLDRSVKDVFSVTDTSWTTVVNNTTFTIARNTDWVSTDNSSIACGAGGGTLQYKKVNISVTWLGMSPASAPVRSDTLIAPNSRINDPTLGTIIVSVRSASGAGTPGVSVTVSPSSPAAGAVALSAQPPVTDADGCTYALKVTPGNYDVTLSNTNYLDIAQNPAPVLRNVQVTAGAAAPAPFTYDNSGVFTLNYGSGPALRPTNLKLTFVSVIGGPYVQTVGTNASSRLFPFTDGYATLAGAYVPPVGSAPSCVDVDPAQWTTAAPDGAVGHPAKTAAALPGQIVPTQPINMGMVTVSGLAANTFITAVSRAPIAGTGDPGCSTGDVYTFPKIPLAGSATIALPYGTWTLYTGTTSGSTSNTVPTSTIAFVTRGVATPPQNAITLDPRTVGP